jgi:hypothetical protein
MNNDIKRNELEIEIKEIKAKIPKCVILFAINIVLSFVAKGVIKLIISNSDYIYIFAGFIWVTFLFMICSFVYLCIVLFRVIIIGFQYLMYCNNKNEI